MRDLHKVHYAKDETIYREGQPSNALYFILASPEGGTATGTVAQQGGVGAGADRVEEAKLTSETDAGSQHERRACQFVPAGGYFGEQGLIYRCDTHTHTHVVQVGGKAGVQISGSSPVAWRVKTEDFVVLY